MAAPSSSPAGRRLAGAGAGLALAALGASAGLVPAACLGPGEVDIDGYRVVRVYEHDPAAYCQGLVFDRGVLLESTGREGISSVRIVELETGKVLKKEILPADLFGEGLALVGDELYQLTWTAGVCRVYDRESLEYRRQYKYEGDGWGLAYDGKHLFQTDGTDQIHVRDPATFEEVRRLHVELDGQPVRKLNELEFVEGELLANLWKDDYVARIDPKTGKVKGYIDLRNLFDYRAIPDEDAVLNGIAYDPAAKRLFVTGKLWPKLFEIEIVEK
jgi:glutamine cyclotransferase